MVDIRHATFTELASALTLIVSHASIDRNENREADKTRNRSNEIRCGGWAEGFWPVSSKSCVQNLHGGSVERTSIVPFIVHQGKAAVSIGRH